MPTVEEVGAFIASPIAGGIAGYLFREEVCPVGSDGGFGGFSFGSNELCYDQYNTEVGIALTCVGWFILVCWAVWERFIRPRYFGGG